MNDQDKYKMYYQLSNVAFFTCIMHLEGYITSTGITNIWNLYIQ